MKLHSWKDKRDHRVFIEQLGKKLGVRSPSDWGFITNRKVIANGGGSFLVFHHGSLFQGLQTVFPGSYSLALNVRNKLEKRMVLSVSQMDQFRIPKKIS